MTGRIDGWVAGLLLALWLLAALALRWGAWAPDLSAVVIAATLWDRGAGDLVYAAPPGFFGGAPEVWAPVMAELGLAGRESFAYVYPPVWAALLAPLTRWGVQPVLDAFSVLHGALLVASVVLAGRLARPEGWSQTRWALWGVAVLSLSLPVVHALMHNQPTILTGFLVLLAAERRQAGQPGRAGAALALAAAIKLAPAAFLILFLLPLSRRALAGFAGTAVAIGALSLALAGWEAHWAFFRTLGMASEATLLIAVNLSLEAGLAGLWFWPASLPAAVVVPGWMGAVAATGGLALVGALALRWRGHTQGPRALLLALAVLVPLTGPLGWLHYYIVPMLLLPALLRLVPAAIAKPVIATVALWAFVPLVLWMRTWPGFDIGFVLAGSAAWLAVVLALLFAPMRP